MFKANETRYSDFDCFISKKRLNSSAFFDWTRTINVPCVKTIELKVTKNVPSLHFDQVYQTVKM